MRMPNADEATDLVRACGCLLQRCLGRQHRFEERQSHSGACAAKKRAASNMFLSYEHGYLLICTFFHLCSRLKRWALDDTQHNRREAIVVLVRVANDRTDDRHIEIFNSAS